MKKSTDNVPKIYMGIDPGKDGAACFKDNEGNIVKFNFPTIGKKELDIALMGKFFNDISHMGYVNAVLEDVHSVYGSSSKATFQFGRSLGIVEALLLAYHIPLLKVAPKAWQSVVFQGIPEMRKPTKSDGKRGNLDTKPMALLAVKRLYPNVGLIATARCKKPHQGIVDALCMMHYCYLKYK